MGSRLILLLACLLCAAMKPVTKQDRDRLRDLKPPSSWQLADATGSSWVLDRLYDPRDAEMRWRPVMKAMLDASWNGKRAVFGVFRCGEVLYRDARGNITIATTYVQYSQYRDGLVLEGMVGFSEREEHFLRSNQCAEIYRDGIPAFPDHD